MEGVAIKYFSRKNNVERSLIAKVSQRNKPNDDISDLLFIRGLRNNIVTDLLSLGYGVLK
jgi:hypothetical protein